MYKGVLFLFALCCVLALTACEVEGPSMQECQSFCEDSCEPQQVALPGAGCLFGDQSQLDYFTVEPVLTRVEDTLCNDAFEDRRNASEYLCSIKRAEPLRRVGRSAEGADQWQWRLDCACSYK